MSTLNKSYYYSQAQEKYKGRGEGIKRRKL